MQPISLHQLNQMVRSVVEDSLSAPVWIQAELSSVSERGQHCYLEFVQKEDGNTGNLIAKARGQIWARTWLLLRPYFEHTTGQPLSPGMKVMVQVTVSFHELYGYSLNVIDINPAYTLGDLAQRRQEIMRILREEGVADMNKTLPLPTLLRRIAVITSPMAAGWGDFRSQLLDNPHGLAFHITLFPATMQGEQVEDSIVSALEEIAQRGGAEFDAVVIIRGGGATSDLTGFDSLRLAEHVAQFPLPVITGIGHERDDTVIDLISHTRVKTPTAAAEFIIHHQLVQYEKVNDLASQIAGLSANFISRHKIKLQSLSTSIPSLTQMFHRQSSMQLSNIEATLRTTVATRIERESHRLQLIDTHIQAADPDKVLRLGYSITRIDGHAVTDAARLHEGDTVRITLHQGTVDATITHREPQ